MAFYVILYLNWSSYVFTIKTCYKAYWRESLIIALSHSRMYSVVDRPTLSVKSNRESSLAFANCGGIGKK